MAFHYPDIQNLTMVREVDGEEHPIGPSEDEKYLPIGEWMERYVI